MARVTKIQFQAVRLSLLVEGSSLLVFFGGYSRAVSDALFVWFLTLNLPTVLLFRFHAWEWHGREMVFPPIMGIIVPAQVFFWFLVWYGVLVGFHKLKAEWRRRHA
jgi:hypothetical protein